MGRPTKYDPAYCDEAIEIMGRQGKSVVQFARHLEVSRMTIYQWAKDYPEFSDTLTHARDWSEAFWEDKYVEFMTDRNVNAPLVKLYFANRFKWADKAPEQEESEEKGPIQYEVVR
jgi:transposase-like protein